MRLGLVLALLAALSGLQAIPAAAHQRSISYSTWALTNRRAQVTVRVAEIDITLLPWSATAGVHLEQALGAYLVTHLKLFAGEQACGVTDGPRTLPASAGRFVYQWTVDCAPEGALHIESTILLDVSPAHLHFARLTRDSGRPLERVLSDSERVWALEVPAQSGGARGSSFGRYITLGIEHIGTGYDHLAFLLVLLLMGSSIGEVARIVTGFTVAHSITLALAVLGYVRPERTAIDALIGMSVALVAAENLWLVSGRNRSVPWGIALLLAGLGVGAARGYGQVPALTLCGLALFAWCYFELQIRHPARLRWAIAFVFGLVHGFGFASVLVEADVSAQRLAQALLGFNIGVEIGQLVIVALIWPLLRLLERSTVPRRWQVVEVGSAAVLVLGVFWFVTRAYSAG